MEAKDDGVCIFVLYYTFEQALDMRIRLQFVVCSRFQLSRSE
jgi:hypothetical protein